MTKTATVQQAWRELAERSESRSQRQYAREYSMSHEAVRSALKGARRIGMWNLQRARAVPGG